MQRVLDLNSGMAMVVTDLHGAWDVYRRLRDQFLNQQAQGAVDYLILCGDLIHSEGLEEGDASLDVLLDIMQLQAALGKDKVLMLLGNHELPHIYGLTLAKGSIEYTPRFEAALTRLDQRYQTPYRRQDVINFLMTLPFFIRTKAGVLLTHAGAGADVNSTKSVERLLNLNHADLVDAADRELKKFDVASLQRGYSHFTGLSYEEQAKRYLAVTGPEDTRYNDLLRVLFLSGQNTDFDLMWNTLFSQNELEVGDTTYQRTVKTFLQCVSDVSPHEQRMLTTGHIGVKDGYAEVGKQQLRFASYTHAFPKRAARYLLLDCENPVKSSADLVGGLKFVFDQAAPTVIPIARPPTPPGPAQTPG
ncbi:MAG TPA: metallophosphoesterase [Phototrophicaceae bacterium]|nr:metallophosphoesterase [Phototrophicaceae bacterium]